MPPSTRLASISPRAQHRVRSSRSSSFYRACRRPRCRGDLREQLGRASRRDAAPAVAARCAATYSGLRRSIAELTIDRVRMLDVRAPSCPMRTSRAFLHAAARSAAFLHVGTGNALRRARAKCARSRSCRCRRCRRSAQVSSITGQSSAPSAHRPGQRIVASGSSARSRSAAARQFRGRRAGRVTSREHAAQLPALQRSRSSTTTAAPACATIAAFARLVVLGREWVGHQNRRSPGRRQLAQRRGAGARQHQIGRRIRVGDIVEICRATKVPCATLPSVQRTRSYSRSPVTWITCQPSRQAVALQERRQRIVDRARALDCRPSRAASVRGSRAQALDRRVARRHDRAARRAPECRYGRTCPRTACRHRANAPHTSSTSGASRRLVSPGCALGSSKSDRCVCHNTRAARTTGKQT